MLFKSFVFINTLFADRLDRFFSHWIVSPERRLLGFLLIGCSARFFTDGGAIPISACSSIWNRGDFCLAGGLTKAYGNVSARVEPDSLTHIRP